MSVISLDPLAVVRERGGSFRTLRMRVPQGDEAGSRDGVGLAGRSWTILHIMMWTTVRGLDEYMVR
jgi:hypothetical protein